MHTLFPNQTSIYHGTILQKVSVWSHKFYCIDPWFLNGVCVTFRTVVFNFFHTATHFTTQFNLTTPFQNFPVMHMKCSCVCTVENHNDKKITYYITMFNKDSLVKHVRPGCVHTPSVRTFTFSGHASMTATSLSCLEVFGLPTLFSLNCLTN